jgi:hypothetical protein
MRNQFMACAIVAMGLSACATDEDMAGDFAADEALTSSYYISDYFDYAGPLITNEYATWNPTHSDAVVNPTWEMNSGSIFARSGTAWTGAPDDVSPNALSTNGNDSAVFRMYSKRYDMKNVDVTVSLYNRGLVTTSRTPATDWDGIHIWLRYVAEDHLYYISVNRRDNTILVKKKIPGGPSNGGTYYILSKSVGYQVPYNTWQTFHASIQTLSDGSVKLALTKGGVTLVSAIDNGTIGGAPITQAGRIGVRGDNCNFQIGRILAVPL